MTVERCDVFVVGGGPAGLSAAIALQQQGIEVLLADALEPPIDKACGEGIMPDSRRELAQFGIALEPHHGAAFDGIRFCDRHSTVSADFSSGEGIGVRRLTLHKLLVERARKLGVRLMWGTRVSLQPDRTAVIANRQISYRYLIGADGQSSRVRGWAGLGQGKVLSRRFGFRIHYRVAPWSRYAEVHWGRLGQAYVTPTSESEVCVSVLTRDPEEARSHEVIQSIPALMDRLKNAQVTTRERGAVTTTRRLKHVVQGNVALIGDASSSADAITGEGLALGFRQARLLAESIRGGSLAAYAAGHAEILRLPQAMARMLLFMDRWHGVRSKALKVLAHEPLLFEKMLSVHMGETSLRKFVIRQAPMLGCRMLLPSQS